MKKLTVLLAAFAVTCGAPLPLTGLHFDGFTASAQNERATGTIIDEAGEPLAGVSITVKGQKGGQITDTDGKFSIPAKKGSILVISYVGYKTKEVKYAGLPVNIALDPDTENLDEVVVTALGNKKDKKSLGYSIDDVSSAELMRNKGTNPLTSLSGKVAGVNITQSSGAAGSGAQIVLRGATSVSETRDSQPLIVVDGVIYDNSTSVGGNSAFDGSTNSSTTSSNRLMDINPEDIENMSILKGPAASALYGSRAANGVILITTKKGKAGNVEVNLNARYITSWVKDAPKAQTTFKSGFFEDQYDANNNYTGVKYNDFAYNSWGERYAEGDPIYDNIGNFFQHGGIWDTNLSVSGGNENGNFFLSGSYYDQTGVVPETGYDKTTFRFNGEQKWKMFTFGANAAYSESHTDKTLTSGGLYGSSGDGALSRLYNYGTTYDMKDYANEDGSRKQLFGDKLDPWNESDNPYWIINSNKLRDKTSRFTGNFNVKADITPWWWIAYRMGVDTYTADYSKRIAPGGVVKQVWQKGMMSDNTIRYHYLSTNFMMNFHKGFGDFDFNLLVGTSTDDTKIKSDYRMAYNFQVANFLSYGNATSENKAFEYNTNHHRLVGLYGELRADWKNTVFLTATARNDWSSTLPKENRSYFYPSVSGAVVFTQFLQDHGLMDKGGVLTFGKIRASWAKVGKDSNPYLIRTSLWPVGTFLNGAVGAGNNWERGNPLLKNETTESTEIGLEMRFFNNRLRFDYAYYTNNTIDQLVSPRGSQATGYIFGMQNVGNVRNKGMELSISGTPIQTKDFTWETGVNLAGNRGRLEGMPKGLEVLYLTDVQYGSAKAASINDGHFAAICGTQWTRDDQGRLQLKNGMYQTSDPSAYYLGDREPNVTGGWNNTIYWKNWSFNMLWEFRFGGYVFEGTKYAMTAAGTSEFSAEMRQKPLVIKGYEGDEYKEYTYEYGKTYMVGGVEKSGETIINDYYSSVYEHEAMNFMKKVNSLRLRTVSLSYDVPRNFLNKTKCIKRCVLSASATNLLLFTNFDGDPEAAASGSGVGGSSSIGFEYCGIPSTASFAFGVNLTF